MTIPLTFFNWLLAFAPVLAVLGLMLGLRWGAGKAGVAGWLVAVAIAALRFGAGWELLALAQGKAVLLTLDVVYIIAMALLLFRVVDEAGAVGVIAERLPRLTADRMMQALILGWLFVSFLQGVGGFGVPVAVVAPLLVGLGFDPVGAVVMASIGHGWAVTFGSLATSFQALLVATEMPGLVIAPPAAIILGIAGVASGLMVAYIEGGWKAVARAVPAVLILGAVMGTVQYLLATSGMWTLGATGAGLTGLALSVLVARLPLYRRGNNGKAGPPNGRSLALALSAYAVLLVIIFSLNLIEPLGDFFGQVRLSIDFPEMVTAYGWTTPAGPGRVINVFGHTGAMLFYASAVGYVIYRLAGCYKEGSLRRILQRTGKGALSSGLGTLAMVAMATTMAHAGMTNMLAEGLSSGVGPRAYPLMAAVIGALGAFMTGSNTNSNVVFGALQQQTAQLLGLSAAVVLATQTASAAIGSVLAPTKVIVGCSTVELSGQEDRVLRRLLIYGVLLVVLVGVLGLILMALAP
jgi:lactate permease